MQVPRYWRTQKQRYSLVGEVCEGCGGKIFPPRDDCKCPECVGVEIDTRGKVLRERSVRFRSKEKK